MRTRDLTGDNTQVVNVPTTERPRVNQNMKMKVHDLEVWYGERVAVLGSNGSGKSGKLHLCLEPGISGVD